MIDLTPEEWTAVALSLRVAFWATLASLPLGLFLAYALSRWRFPGRALLSGLVHLPLILPPVVTGYLLLLAFGRQGAIGVALESWFGVVFAFRWTGAALAGAVMGFPLMVRAMRLALDAVDPKLEQAGEHGLRLDSRKPTIPFAEFANTEGRFAMVARTDSDAARNLLRQAQTDIDDRWHLYEQMVEVERTARYGLVDADDAALEGERP